MIPENYKKIVALVGITAILASVIFFSFPQKTKALVPVIDPAVGASTAGTLTQTIALVTKEFALDAVLKTLAQTLLRSITQSVVQWIRSGFRGQPLFITNFDAYLADATDQATGTFMREYLTPEFYNLLCRPWRFNVGILLQRTSIRYQRQRCTLNRVLANAENGVTFGAALRRGRWEDWMGVALSPQNNPHGAILSQLDALMETQNKAKDRAKTESIFNQGFLSMKECVTSFPDEYTGEPYCTEYQNTTPGKWIQTQLSSATGIDFQEIALADEINEIISALISQMLSTVLQGGILRIGGR